MTRNIREAVRFVACTIYEYIQGKEMNNIGDLREQYIPIIRDRENTKLPTIIQSRRSQNIYNIIFEKK